MPSNSPSGDPTATFKRAANDPCPCLETCNITPMATLHFPEQTGRIELSRLLKRWDQAPTSQTEYEKKKEFCPTTRLLYTPHVSKILFAQVQHCALPPLAGRPHPSLDPSLVLALAAPRLGCWDCCLPCGTSEQ